MNKRDRNNLLRFRIYCIRELNGRPGSAVAVSQTLQLLPNRKLVCENAKGGKYSMRKSWELTFQCISVR